MSWRVYGNTCKTSREHISIKHHEFKCASNCWQRQGGYTLQLWPSLTYVNDALEPDDAFCSPEAQRSVMNSVKYFICCVIHRKHEFIDLRCCTRNGQQTAACKYCEHTSTFFFRGLWRNTQQEQNCASTCRSPSSCWRLARAGGLQAPQPSCRQRPECSR